MRVMCKWLIRKGSPGDFHCSGPRRFHYRWKSQSHYLRTSEEWQIGRARYWLARWKIPESKGSGALEEAPRAAAQVEEAPQPEASSYKPRREKSGLAIK